MTRPIRDRLAYAAEASYYEAWRAAALSAVPTRTVYHWASTGLVIPSVSAVKEMLWSYADVMTLRIVAWLRRRKEVEGTAVPASTMREVRWLGSRMSRAHGSPPEAWPLCGGGAFQSQQSPTCMT